MIPAPADPEKSTNIATGNKSPGFVPFLTITHVLTPYFCLVHLQDLPDLADELIFQGLCVN